MPKTVLITGANRGIDLALARAAAARGDTVLATMRPPETATARDRLRAEGDAVTSLALDATEPVWRRRVGANAARATDMAA